MQDAVDNKFCSECSYPLTPQAYEEIKAEENEKFKAIQQKYGTDIALLKEEMRVEVETKDKEVHRLNDTVTMLVTRLYEVGILKRD